MCVYYGEFKLIFFLYDLSFKICLGFVWIIRLKKRKEKDNGYIFGCLE